ncbi:hypothetical protein KA005_28290 [bacterium]|nr:hypothetical protein [bacterium]
MKLPKGVTIRHQGQTYKEEIPDKFAFLVPDGQNNQQQESGNLPPEHAAIASKGLKRKQRMEKEVNEAD